MEDTMKGYVISSIFIFVLSIGILMFVIQYPQLNNRTTILNQDVNFMNSTQNLSNSLGGYQTQSITEINVTTSTNPTETAYGTGLVSTVSNAESITSRVSGSFKAIYFLVANTLGLNTGTFSILLGALISIIMFLAFYYIIKLLRTGN